MKSIVAAYLAGIIDGEGWIGITRRKAYGHEKAERFMLTLVISNHDMRLIDWLCTFGGRVKPHGHGWQWHVDQLAAEHILRAVQPFLIVKRKQCNLALEFRAIRITTARLGTPQSVIDQRVEFHRAIKVENQRLRNPGAMSDWYKGRSAA